MRQSYIPDYIIKGKEKQRKARRDAEKAALHADALELDWKEEVMIWAGTRNLKFSNIYCAEAPADADCVLNLDKNLHPCIFCGNPEDPIL